MLMGFSYFTEFNKVIKVKADFAVQLTLKGQSAKLQVFPNSLPGAFQNHCILINNDKAVTVLYEKKQELRKDTDLTKTGYSTLFCGYGK